MVSTPVVAGESACAGDHGVWQSYSTLSLQFLARQLLCQWLSLANLK